MITKEAELHGLLVSLFDIFELRHLVNNLPDGQTVASQLPVGAISISELSYAIIDELSRRGRIGSDFFDLLLSLRPEQTSRIREVWKLWEAAPEEWSAPPSDDIRSKLRLPKTKETKTEAVRVFVSYSRRDRLFYEELQSYLAVLSYQGVIDIWSEGRILAGEEWRKVIQEAIDETEIFILLISPDFMASEYSSRYELDNIRKRSDEGAVIIPVIVRPTNIPENHIIRRLQWLPRDGVPISSRDDTDEAWVEVAENIRAIAKNRK